MPPTRTKTTTPAEKAPAADDAPATPEETSAPAGAEEPAAGAVLTRDPEAHPQIVDLKGCARCRTNAHPGLVFEPLDYPIDGGTDDEGQTIYTHWAACPTNGQPILFGAPELEAEPEPVPPADVGTA